MKKYVQMIFLKSDWQIEDRKHFIKEVLKITNDWGDAILVQLPVSLFVHVFTKFGTKFLGLFKGKYKTKIIEDNVILFTPIILFHYNIWLKFRLFALVDIFLLSFQLNNFAKKHYSGKEIILWVCYPRLYPLIRKINHKFLVYDFQDNYDYDLYGNKLLRESYFNKEIIRISNLVICTANILYKSAVSINKNSILVQNGNNFNIFSRRVNATSQNELSDLGKPIVGYLGAVKIILDFDLINFLIGNIKDVYFVFIGFLFNNAKVEFRKVLRNPNVIWIKFKEQEELPDYVRRFNVGIMPFKINKYTEGVFPNKLFEYMAAEVPTVTTALPDLEKYSDYIGYSRSNSEFLANCKKAISGECNSRIVNYSKIAEENSWIVKAKVINDQIKSVIGKY